MNKAQRSAATKHQKIPPSHGIRSDYFKLQQCCQGEIRETVGEIMNKMGWPANPRDAYQRHERRRIEFRNRAQALFDRSKS
jgi:hypothetical protein